MKKHLSLVPWIPILMLAQLSGVGCASSKSSSSEGTASGTASSLNATGLYHRLYWGFKKADLSREDFEEKINQKFLPEFADAHLDGLMGYRAALLKGVKDCNLPQKVSILSYANEGAMNRYRESKVGKKIRDAHLPVFSSNSRNLVVENFADERTAGLIREDRAYALKSDPTTVADFSSMIVYCNSELSEPRLISKLAAIYQSGTRASNLIFALHQGHLVEVLFYGKEDLWSEIRDERNKKLAGLFLERRIIPLKKMRIGSARVKRGEGIDSQWQ